MYRQLNFAFLAGVSLAILSLSPVRSQDATPAAEPVQTSQPVTVEAPGAVVPNSAAAEVELLALPLPPEAVISFTEAAPSTAVAIPPPASAAAANVLQAGDDRFKALIAGYEAAPLQTGAFAPTAAAQRKERAAVADFYGQRNFAPVWFVEGKATAAALSAMRWLEHANDDGLDLRATPNPTTPRDGSEAINAELALTKAVLAYGRQASGGRIDPQHISELITSKPETAEPAKILAAVTGAGADAGEVLHGFNPPHKGYEALRRKLAELRQARPPVARERIPAGPTLRIGMHDPRVPLIRARFGLGAATSEGPAEYTYDTQIATAIADFQRANGLPTSGILTPRTIAALSGGEPSRLENEILANMERWRWLPRDLGRERIEVNIPEFTVRVVDGDAVLHQARVVVGKPDTPTPVFSNSMQFLIVNPYWSVPQSIIKKEMLPKLAADPNYLHRLGYEVVRRGNLLTVRQPPGERNALGRIKFMFPNDHAVYLHDTPSRALFANDLRAYSHGCVRVDQPFKLAEIVLGAAWNEARLKGLIGGPERTIHLPQPLPIHIEYFTASVDAAGRLQLYDDIYGYSQRLKLALGLLD